MLDKLMIHNFLKGYVRVWNEAGMVVESHNLVVYHGGDIIAQLLAGNPEYRISHMYFAYENTVGVPAPPAEARTDTVAYFDGLVAPEDYIRTPILEPPQLVAGDVDHNFNRVTFVAVASAIAGEHGVPFGAASNSQVSNIGLVAAPTGIVTGDILYARYVLPVALPAVGSGQISATWATEAI
jgi:hypothetical protein